MSVASHTRAESKNGRLPSLDKSGKCLLRLAHRWISQGWPNKAGVAELGFTDSTHLCSEFRKRCGATPQCYAPVHIRRGRPRAQQMSSFYNNVALLQFSFVASVLTSPNNHSVRQSFCEPLERVASPGADTEGVLEKETDNMSNENSTVPTITSSGNISTRNWYAWNDLMPPRPNHLHGCFVMET